MTSGAPTVFVNISHLVPGVVDYFEQLPTFVADLEHWGADGVVLGEHVIRTRSMQHPNGLRLPFPPTEPSLEPLATLASFTSCTSRLRLATSIVVAPLRHGVVLAKTAATVSVLSGGRLELGLGAGWADTEFKAAGIDFDNRFNRLEDAIRMCKSLWARPPASHAGPFGQFEDAYAEPRPSTGSLPVWLGGGASPATARRVVELADGWIASAAAGPAEIARGREQIELACKRFGRPGNSIGVRATVTIHGSPELQDRSDVIDGGVESARACVAAGADSVILPLSSMVRARTAVQPVIESVTDVVHGLRLPTRAP